MVFQCLHEMQAIHILKQNILKQKTKQNKQINEKDKLFEICLKESIEKQISGLKSYVIWFKEKLMKL